MPNPHQFRTWQTIARFLTAALFVLAGIKHFTNPGFYLSIVPPGFPSPAMLVLISGICEIIGGVGLLVRPLRRIAGWGLILLLIAVFPANIYMAQHPEAAADLRIAHWVLWLRLPLQGVLILWVCYISQDHANLRKR